MQSLQDQALTILFNQYLTNKPPNETTKQLIATYLKENKSIIDKYIKQEPLYHVFHRGNLSNDNGIDYISLIETFSSLDEARKWIIQNGRKILNIDDIPNKLTSLVIISKRWEESESMDMMPMSMHPTFVFNQESYEMILEEHKILYTQDWITTPIIDWVYFVKDNGTIIQGCSWEHVVDTMNYYRKNQPKPYVGGWPHKELLDQMMVEYEAKKFDIESQ